LRGIRTPESVSLERASEVYLVRINAMETVMSGDVPCGSRYHALVKNAIKGDLGAKKVIFGFWQNLEIGRTYKIFLKPMTREGLIHMLEDRGSIDDVQRYVAACIDVMPKSYFFRADKL